MFAKAMQYTPPPKKIQLFAYDGTRVISVSDDKLVALMYDHITD